MNDKTFLQSVASGAGILINNAKKKIQDKRVYKQGLKTVKEDAKKEAEKIFMKTQPGVKGNPKSYPKVNEYNRNDQGVFAGFTKSGRQAMYGNRADAVEKQVVKTRVKQYKNKSGK